MGVKHGRRGLAETEKRAGARHDDQESADRAYNYHVRIRRDDDSLCLSRRFAYLRDLDEISDEHHRYRQVAAVTDVSRLRRDEEPAIRIDVRPSDNFYVFRHYVLYRYR